MTKVKCILFVAAALDLHGVGLAKGGPIRISTIIDASEKASAEMMSLFRRKIAEHDTLFKLVTNDDGSTGIIFQADCMARPFKDAPYVCF